MQHLKHTKTDRVHNLEFSGKFNPMNSNFIVETEFQATALYEVGDTFTVNGTKFNATLNPNVYGLFMVNDIVHCVVDFYRKNLVIVNMHKAKFDALWVFNPKNPNITESSATGNAMKDGSSEVIASLFFGYGDEDKKEVFSLPESIELEDEENVIIELLNSFLDENFLDKKKVNHANL